MAIGVKTDSENERLLVPFFSHYCKINALPASSSGKKPLKSRLKKPLVRGASYFLTSPFSLKKSFQFATPNPESLATAMLFPLFFLIMPIVIPLLILDKAIYLFQSPPKRFLIE
jgi:cellulose synthase/poly-beta-1,6-N-acetylglucosamine synthase-like glycosyltransferase